MQIKLNEVSTIADEDMPTIGLTCRCMENVNFKVLLKRFSVSSL